LAARTTPVAAEDVIEGSETTELLVYAFPAGQAMPVQRRARALQLEEVHVGRVHHGVAGRALEVLEDLIGLAQGEV
jgi:hypothetical protein